MPKINKSNIVTSLPDDDALSTVAQNDLVINLANLTTTGDRADGIFVGADGTTVRNFGTIMTSGLGAMGIHVEGQNTRVVNFGIISTTGNYDPDGEFTSEGISVFGDEFQIINHGDVTVSGDYASALVGIGDGGLIANFGSINSTSIETIVVGIAGNGGQIVNHAQIDVGGIDSSALLARGEQSSIINWGQITLSGDIDEGITLQRGDSEAYNNGIIFVNAQAAFGMIGRGTDITLANAGSIMVQGDGSMGIAATGGRVTPEGVGHQIFNSGEISVNGVASFGIALGLSLPDILPVSASYGVIQNSGSVETSGDGSAAVVIVGDNHEFSNTGQVTANGGSGISDLLGSIQAAGVLVSGDNVSIENGQTGTISSDHVGSAAIELNIIERVGITNADLFAVVQNSGLIEGVDVAIIGGDGSETIVNHGQILGGVFLGGGNDEFVFGNGGSLVGELYLGDGMDMVGVEKGAGLVGIADFAAGDLLDVSAFHTNFAALIDHSYQEGSDVVINLNHNDSIVLANTLIGSLDVGDFLF